MKAPNDTAGDVSIPAGPLAVSFMWTVVVSLALEYRADHLKADIQVETRAHEHMIDGVLGKGGPGVAQARSGDDHRAGNVDISPERSTFKALWPSSRMTNGSVLFTWPPLRLKGVRQLAGEPAERTL